MENKYITLDYGSGGKKTAELIEKLIVPAFNNDALNQLSDGAVLSGAEKLVFSTDSFVVNPYFFPGGDIGKLSVCGTVNDICMAGGDPKYLSLSFIIEEGFPMEDLERIIESIRQTAESAGVFVVTGDTKVVEKGKGDGLYINTAGIGFLKCPGLSEKNIKEGDAVLVSGPVGNHGISVMMARNPGLLKGNLLSDCAVVKNEAFSLMQLGSSLKVMRDPTRGGLATTLCEFVEGSGLSIELSEESIPVSSATKAACDILGLDALYCACEGRITAVVDADRALEAVKALNEAGASAAIIGTVGKRYPGRVVLKNAFGGERFLTRLSGSQLPRIC